MTFLKRKGLVYLFRNHHSTYSAAINDVYILSAVRTPIGLVNGSLQQTTDFHLSAFALKEASDRARTPLDDIQKIFLGCVGRSKINEGSGEELLQLAGSTRKIPLTLVHCGLQSVILASEYLSKVDGVCGAGGVELMSGYFENKTCPQPIFPLNARGQEEELQKQYTRFSKEERNAYVLQNKKNLQNAVTTKPFEDEIFKVILYTKGKRNIIRLDDRVSQFKNLQGKPIKLESKFASAPADGASVLLIASGNYVKKNKLTPLARIVSAATDSLNSSDFLSTRTTDRALLHCKCEAKEIFQWEIDDYFCDLGLSAMKKYKINQSQFNKDGGTLTLGHPIGMSGARLLCHLAHSLESEKLGCASSNNPCGVSSSVIIKKLDAEKNSVPKMVMYSKANCPLCTKMKQQLQSYSENIEIEEVDIWKKGNEKFRKIYDWDIPVLFLDGRFLCKYTLNYELLRRRLLQSKRKTNNIK